MSRGFPKGDPRASAAGRKGGEVTAASRLAEKEPYTGDIISLMDLAGMTEAKGWLPWRSFWKGVYALPMSPEELAVYQKHTKRETPPQAQVAEAWMCIGRGGGKTKNSALHAVFRAISFKTVDPGEDVIIPLLASDRRQARSALKYMRQFNALPEVAPYVFRGTLKETIEYKTGVNVEVQTASKTAPRGFSCPTCCCDEIAWWENEEDHVNPDSEVITAVRGSLGRVKGSLLLALSNPAAPRGELYQAHSDYYGVADPDVLVWNASTLSMNPTYDPRAIARAFKKDAVVAVAEFGVDGFVQFRQHQQALFDMEPLSNAITMGRKELPPVEGTKYVCFIDAAEGSRSGDSMTLGIAHREGPRAVLDLIRVAEPPFSPGEVIANIFAPVLADYGISKIFGDRHAIGFVSAALRSLGVTFEPTKLSKSDLYGELLPLVNTGMVELLDLPTLRTQLLALMRRSVRGGRDSIDHPAGAHDDLANACAGALVHVTGVGVKAKKRVRVARGDGDGNYEERRGEERMREQLAALGMLAKRINASRDAQNKRAWALAAVHEYDEIGTVRAGEKATGALRDVLGERE
jgi:hypothetical protein